TVGTSWATALGTGVAVAGGVTTASAGGAVASTGITATLLAALPVLGLGGVGAAAVAGVAFIAREALSSSGVFSMETASVSFQHKRPNKISKSKKPKAHMVVTKPKSVHRPTLLERRRRSTSATPIASATTAESR
ncbi:unnamed protein product, partial [Symbiodinium pilosum]